MNEHTALYRKYRPASFKDVVGQDQVVKVLQSSIKLGNISHAYLFAGSRGTGKTSIARILAREIGCTQTDLYEIDAASNRGIDDIRELKESVNTMPFESPYKVYIIDEAHMLTKEAFNALLKTLEEPPKHVVFILATTEMDKLPETIISRCQTYTFKRPSQKILREVISDISKKEGYVLENAGAELIALLGDGSFRDAQGMLEKVLNASQDKKITVSEVELVVGAPRAALVNDVVASIADGSREKALMVVQKITDANVDMKVFLKLLLEKVRFIMLIRAAPEMSKIIEELVSPDDFEMIKKMSEAKNSRIQSKTLLELLNAHDGTGRSAIPQLPLELALINIISEK